MRTDETNKVETYLKKKLNQDLRLVKREKSSDSVEIYMGQEFLGLVYKIEEEEEISYQLQMTILQEDLLL